MRWIVHENYAMSPKINSWGFLLCMQCCWWGVTDNYAVWLTWVIPRATAANCNENIFLRNPFPTFKRIVQPPPPQLREIGDLSSTGTRCFMSKNHHLKIIHSRRVFWSERAGSCPSLAIEEGLCLLDLPASFVSFSNRQEVRKWRVQEVSRDPSRIIRPSPGGFPASEERSYRTLLASWTLDFRVPCRSWFPTTHKWGSYRILEQIRNTSERLKPLGYRGPSTGSKRPLSTKIRAKVRCSFPPP